jgi:fatty acid-binding protein DegV
VEERPEAIPVLSMVQGEIRAVGQAYDVDEAVAAMADYVLLGGEHLRVAVGVADVGSTPLARALQDALAGNELVKEIVQYRIGPSVGVHTGPGTAGAFFYPAVV